MAKVKETCRHLPQVIAICDDAALLRGAAQEMNDHKIWAVLRSLKGRVGALHDLYAMKYKSMEKEVQHGC